MINVFFAPGTRKIPLPEDRLAHAGFPCQPGKAWLAALGHERPTVMAYRRGYLLDHTHGRLSAEKVDGLELEVDLPSGRLSLEWWATPTWRMVRGWAWYPARKVTLDEAMELLA